MTNDVLILNNISKTYPGVKALDNVSISFKQGEVHAIVGENGAGKSTLIKAIAGVVIPDKGDITIDGELLHNADPLKAISMGISVIYQEFNLFDSLSAAENIFLGEKLDDEKHVNYKKMYQKASELFKRFDVHLNPQMPVRNLSPAYKQIIEISKAIHKNAKIIIMDEPTAPLTRTEAETLFSIINDLKNEGITIIYISHRLEEIFAIADRVSVMRDGKYIVTKNVSDTNRDELIALMVGRELKKIYPVSCSQKGNIALEVKNLKANRLHDISFSARKGEIVGMAGLVGAGRTELMRIIYGADRLESGEIYVNGNKVSITSPSKALELGIGLIPEDRKEQGLFLQNAIKWNVSISNVKNILKNSVINNKQEIEQAKKFSEMLNIKSPSINQTVLHLSGGNQQKVVLAKVLAANTDIIIFDEPTRGIDVGAREEIYQLMNKLASECKTILMVSSDMEELLGLSDRILVMHDGTIVGELHREEFQQKRILELACGQC
jgi:ABC-type sugar transport system, ATPase component